MAISVGDKIPEVTLVKATAEGPQPVSSSAYFAGKTVALFSVPGAFTPTCSAKHVPGFVAHAQALRAKGVDEVWCVSVNDAFVMGSWGRELGTRGKVRMFGDGNAEFSKAIDLTLDLTGRGMGVRSNRYAMIVQDGVVSYLAVEAPGQFEVSSAEAVLAKL